MAAIRSGVVIGVVEVVGATSFAVLIFPGNLSRNVPAGIGLALFTPRLELLYRYPEPVVSPDESKDSPDYLGVEDPRQVHLADPVARASGIAVEQFEDRKSPLGLGRLEVGGREVDQRLPGHAGTGAAEPYLDHPTLCAGCDVQVGIGPGGNDNLHWPASEQVVH